MLTSTASIAQSSPTRASMAAGLPSLRPSLVAFHSAGSEIYAPGDKANALYHVEFGAVRIYRLLADGRRQISAFHIAGEPFGFEADAVHHFFAEAICASGIRMRRLQTGGSAPHDILPMTLDALARAQEHLLVVGRQSALERVAAFLLDMMDRQGDQRHIELSMSRSDIGDYLGLTIETVSRAFSRLKEDGYIRLQSARDVEIMRRDRLRALCE